MISSLPSVIFPSHVRSLISSVFSSRISTNTTVGFTESKSFGFSFRIQRSNLWQRNRQAALLDLHTVAGELEALFSRPQLPLYPFLFDLRGSSRVPFGFYVFGNDRPAVQELKEQISHHHWHNEGLIYFQNVSSMVPALVIDPNPGELIADFTAAPGSKTLLLVDLLLNSPSISSPETSEIVREFTERDPNTKISAYEAVTSRFFRLEDNLRQYKASPFVKTRKMDSRRLFRLPNLQNRFDKILLDVPCSGTGRLLSLSTTDRERNETLKNSSKNALANLVATQKQLFWSAFHCLKPGGSLVYSTCSILEQENEEIILWALDRLGDQIAIENIDDPQLMSKVYSLDFSSSPNATGLLVSQPGELPLRPKIKESQLERVSQVRNSLRIVANGLCEGFFVCKIKKIS